MFMWERFESMIPTQVPVIPFEAEPVETERLEFWWNGTAALVSYSDGLS